MSSSDSDAASDDRNERESEKNTRLIQSILNQPMASDWEGNQYNYKPYELIALSSDSPEYEEIEELFSETNCGHTITNIGRVENPFLLGQYLMKKEKMSRENPYDLEEKTFFHGTNKCNVHGICKYNFDWRRTGEACGSRFGQGVSFTPQVRYAQYYTVDNIFFMVKVLVGRSTIGDKYTVLPPEPYDTTDNGKSTVYVKYEDDDFYPQYVITCDPTDSLEFD